MARRSDDDETDDGPDGGPDDGGAREEAVARAADLLYAADPDDFMARRAELAKQARRDGDPAAAKRIGGLRKPTAPASVVNRLVHDDPECVDRLRDLGERLRAAQDELDAPLLRDLSMERRALVGSLANAAFAVVGQDDPSTALRDEVVATLDAAVADPEVAGRLGRLTRPERWSGFGFAAVSGPPALTVVRGGRDRTRGASGHRSSSVRGAGKDRSAGAPTPTAPREKAPTTDPAASGAAAEKRRRARALDKARAAFEVADAALDAAATAEESAAERIRTLTDEIAERQRALDEAKRALDDLRREHRAARTRRREARSALDRAERAADRA